MGGHGLFATLSSLDSLQILQLPNKQKLEKQNDIKSLFLPLKCKTLMVCLRPGLYPIANSQETDVLNSSGILSSLT